ncbi:hypothetical protein ACVCNR_14835 [Aquamicrobium terrae]
MAFAMIAVATFIAYRLWPAWAAVCPTGEGLAECSRAWISALSGWIAAMAAGTTVIWLARQLHVTRQQTEFVVGEADPVASLFDPRERHIDDAFANRLQIVNWNRNPILVREISIPGGQGFTKAHISVVDHDPGRRSTLADELARGRIFIPGWLDRSKAPTFAEFDITLVAPPESHEDSGGGLLRSALTVDVTIVVAGNEHRIVKFNVSRPDALVIAEFNA